MASFRDPAKTFSPIEVIERLLEITDYFGHQPILYISRDDDLAMYLDSFGFDVYSLTTDTKKRFDMTMRSVEVMPSGSRSHESVTAH
ncbi:MAG TPA: hypothetical protein VKA60_22935 [Blastocatellia bacterium]|nr:hypothetical protein [Blastocatellia bacterium]